MISQCICFGFFISSSKHKSSDICTAVSLLFHVIPLLIWSIYLFVGRASLLPVDRSHQL